METLTKNKCIKISDDLVLNRQSINHSTRTVKSIITGRDVFIWIDCSGSMSSSIRLIASDLKNKVVTLLKPDDRLYLGYFSGLNEFGFLQEDVQIKDLTDLKPIHDAIDRYIRALCLTGFRQPLELTEKIIKSKQSKDRVTVLFFLTDGYDNQSLGGDRGILEVCKNLAPLVNSAIIVEYGYYCNRELLSKMASTLGGSHIFAENFLKYEPVIERFVSNNNVVAGKKLEIEITGKVLHDLIFTIKDNDVICFEPENSKIQVSPDIQEVYYFTKTGFIDTSIPITDSLHPVYAGMGLLSQRMKSNDVFQVLKKLGDVEFIMRFNNAFGKQNLSVFQEKCFNVATGKEQPYKDGKNFSLIPPDNAYCILDLFNDLLSGDNYFYPDHEDFNYNRIGVKTIPTASILSDEEQEELDELLTQVSKEIDVQKVKDLNDKIVSLKTKKAPLSFTKDALMKPYPLNKLVWNKNRANLSVQVTYQGSVLLPENNFNLPENFPTISIRAYTFVKDGILNVKELPVSLDNETFHKLVNKSLINPDKMTFDESWIYTLDLTKLNVINRSMVKEVKAEDTFNLSLGLLSYQAEAKVFKYLEDIHFSRNRSSGITDKYGQEAADWLKSIGITDGGFSPSGKAQKSGETYPAVELNIKIPTSTLPAVEKMLEKVTKGKDLNLAESMMNDAYNKYKDFISTTFYLNSSNKDNLLKTWLQDETKAIVNKTREVNTELAKIKFAVIVGGINFVEFKTQSDNQLTVKSKWGDIVVSSERKDIQIEI